MHLHLTMPSNKRAYEYEMNDVTRRRIGLSDNLRNDQTDSKLMKRWGIIERWKDEKMEQGEKVKDAYSEQAEEKQRKRQDCSKMTGQQ